MLFKHSDRLLTLATVHALGMQIDFGEAILLSAAAASQYVADKN
jgi:Na+/serine symporter